MNEQKQDTQNLVGDFIGGFNVDAPVHLVLGISDGNKKEEGDDLRKFVEMVNYNKIKIESVEIMVTAYIQRHYHGEQEALKKRDEWIAKNEVYLKKLKRPYSITDWKDIIETNEFKIALDEIKELYITDDAFRLKIDNVAQGHRQKANVEKCKEYVLEEAAYFYYKKVHVCYPADRLNLACEHIIENYNKDAVFHAYRFKPRFSAKIKTKPENRLPTLPTPQPLQPNPDELVPPYIMHRIEYTPEDAFFAAMSLARIMGKIGLNGTRDKVNYFEKVIVHNEKFISHQYREVSNAGTNEDSEGIKVKLNT